MEIHRIVCKRGLSVIVITILECIDTSVKWPTSGLSLLMKEWRLGSLVGRALFIFGNSPSELEKTLSFNLSNTMQPSGLGWQFYWPWGKNVRQKCVFRLNGTSFIVTTFAAQNFSITEKLHKSYCNFETWTHAIHKRWRLADCWFSPQTCRKSKVEWCLHE